MKQQDKTPGKPIETVAQILINVLLRRLREDKARTGAEKS
jgi:hypothetical protein